MMGKKLFHLGPNGAGQTIKLAMNAILALQVGALAEAIGLVTKAGLRRNSSWKCCRRAWRGRG